MRILCDACGEVGHCYFDGYDFAERLLEGIKFHAKVVDNKIVVSVADEHKLYFENFNQEKWLDEALDHAQSTDVMNCDCGGSCWIEK